MNTFLPRENIYFFSVNLFRVFAFSQITHLDVPYPIWHFESLLALHWGGDVRGLLVFFLLLLPHS